MISCFSEYRSYEGIATDAYVTVLFAFKSRAIYVSAIDQSITIRFQRADGTYGDEVTYDPFSLAFPIPIFLQSAGFMVRNTLAGVVGSYSIQIYK